MVITDEDAILTEGVDYTGKLSLIIPMWVGGRVTITGARQIMAGSLETRFEIIAKDGF